MAGVPPVLNMVGLVLAGGALLRYGTPEQQAQHLRATLAADHVWCQLFSEPGAGSDLGSLSTRAERDGDRFIVNGQKVWCSGGRVSNWGILMARTDPDAAKHDGISFFLCPMDLPGIEVRPLRQMTGGAEFDEVFFTDVELPGRPPARPAARRVGRRDERADQRARPHRHGGDLAGAPARAVQPCSAPSAGSGPSARQRLASLMATGTAYKSLAQRQRDQGGAIATTGGSLLKLGITEMMFDVATLRADTAGAGGAARRARRPRPAGRAGWPHRRRHEPGPAQHHRRTPARPAPRATLSPAGVRLQQFTRRFHAAGLTVALVNHHRNASPEAPRAPRPPGRRRSPDVRRVRRR